MHAIEEEVDRLVKPRPVKEANMLHWRLDSTGIPPHIGVVVEVEAALGTMPGVETPAGGFNSGIRSWWQDRRHTPPHEVQK